MSKVLNFLHLPEGTTSWWARISRGKPAFNTYKKSTFGLSSLHHLISTHLLPSPHVDGMCILSFSLHIHPVRLQKMQDRQKGAGILRDHTGQNGLLLFGLDFTFEQRTSNSCSLSASESTLQHISTPTPKFIN